MEPGSAMTQSELEEERIPKFYRKSRVQWKGSLDSGSELKKDSGSTGLRRKDTNSDPSRCSPGSLIDVHSDQYRTHCPEISDMNCSTKLRCSAFEDEYQPLPSPSGVCLRKKRSPSRLKEGVRVTFAPDAYLQKKSTCSQTEALPSSTAEWPEDWCISQYPRRGRPGWGSLSEPVAFPESPGGCGDIRTPFRPCSELCPCCTPGQLPLAQPKTAGPEPKMELEPSSSRLFTRMSDLHVGTHLPEEAARSRNFLEVSHSWDSSHCGPSLDRLLDSQSPGTQGISQSHISLHHSPPASLSGLESKDLQSLSKDLRSLSSSLSSSTVSAYHPLTALNNDPARDPQDLGAREGTCLTRPLPPPISELSSVLRQLLDLVDQHWSGPRSLQFDPQFLTSAYDLLASLALHPPAQFERGRSPWRMKGVDKNGDKNGDKTGISQKNQPTQTHLQMESSKKCVATATEERNSQVSSKPESAAKMFESGRQWDQCLQRQVKALREQERHFKQMEETMGLLQDSHRSLLSSNNSLMEQLNNPTSN